MIATETIQLLHRNCLWCGRQYRAKSRPYWAIDRNLLIAGTVHAAHAALWRRHHGLPAYHTLTRMLAADEAHRTAWWRQYASRTKIKSSLLMTTLFRLPDQRRKLLRQWARQNSPFTAERVAAAMAEAEAVEILYRTEYPTDDHIIALAALA